MTRLCRIGGWLALATVAFLTLGPVDDRPQVAAAPHLEHFAAFLLLGLVFAVGYPSRPMRAVLIVVGSAILLEILQLLTPDRHARAIDAMAKVTGAAFGITLTRLVLNSWQAKLRSAPAVSTVVRRGERERERERERDRERAGSALVTADQLPPSVLDGHRGRAAADHRAVRAEIELRLVV
jgi:VanZ family protein